MHCNCTLQLSLSPRLRVNNHYCVSSPWHVHRLLTDSSCVPAHAWRSAWPTMSRVRQPPLVTGISPNEGTSWTKVTIRGENLGTGPADLVGTTHTYTWKHKLAQTLSVSIKLYMFPPLSNYLLMRHNQQIRYMRRGWVRIGENLWRSIQFIEEGRGWGEKWDQG